jgi:hypothetical protein
MKYIYFSIFILSCIGCESNSKVYIENAPKELLDEDKFIDTYKELLLIEATARITAESGLKADSMILVNSDYFLASKNINRKTYQQSYDYYAINAEKFLKINEAIKVGLGAELEKIKK